MTALPKHSLTILETPPEARLQTWLQFVRVLTRTERRVAQMMIDHGITLPQFDVLSTLRLADGVTQQELAERLLVTKGNVCGLVTRLEEAGFVDRRADSRDARVNRLHLTAKGRQKVATIMPEHDAFLLGLMNGISDEELRVTRSVLRRLEAAAE